MSDNLTFWFTGLSRPRKSALAAALDTALSRRGRRVEWITDSELCAHPSNLALQGPHAARGDVTALWPRTINIVGGSGIVSVSIAAPFCITARRWVRVLAIRFKGFVEVYAAAANGSGRKRTLLPCVTDPYEFPNDPAILEFASTESAEEIAAKVLARLETLKEAVR